MLSVSHEEISRGRPALTTGETAVLRSPTQKGGCAKPSQPTFARSISQSQEVTSGTDLALAWRRLWNAPAFSAVAVATLALAIGANTAIFTIADAVLFRPLPFADPSRVNVVTVRDRRSGTLLPSVPIDYVMAIDVHHRGLGRVGLRGPTLMMTHSGTATANSIVRDCADRSSRSGMTRVLVCSFSLG